MGRSNETHQLAIIGAGPAGLAAASAAAQLDPVLFELGPSIGDRRQTDRFTSIHGVGGAGLFSDGKFSFWPSASRLWDLDPELLTSAYEAIRNALSWAMPTFPSMPALGGSTPSIMGDVKRYESLYSSPVQRREITETLAKRSRSLFANTSIDSATHDGRVWRLQTSNGNEVLAETLLLAGGRFSAITLQRWLPSSCFTYRRLEVGVRIEQPRNSFFLRGMPELDPKYIFSDSAKELQWRTFCCCRDGVVVETESLGLLTVSGRADCAPTGRSNVGFNTRFLRRNDAQAEWPGLIERVRLAERSVSEDFSCFVNGGDGPLRELFGPRISDALIDGLRRLTMSFDGEDLAAASLVGPAIEGTMMYPIHRSDLSVVGAQGAAWVAGDAAGDFRGLTAALVSGHVAGLSILRWVKERLHK